jgi:hypothetical protein
MSINLDLLQTISTCLGSLNAPNLTSASRGCDLYEAYLWTLVIEAARREQATVTFVNTLPGSPPVFVFPTGPHAIFSTNTYSYAELSFPNCPGLEAHVGVYIAGRSQVTHECDIAVLDQTEADFARYEDVHPRCSKVLLAIEAKFYGARLGIDLARGFLGLTEEIQATDRFFAANTTSASVSKMLAKHRRGWETSLIPSNANAEQRLRGHFETVFKNYKARF